jgi:hypothetical protein
MLASAVDTTGSVPVATRLDVPTVVALTLRQLGILLFYRQCSYGGAMILVFYIGDPSV